MDDLRSRLSSTRWPDDGPAEPWVSGPPVAFLKDLCGYWCEAFDWKAQVEQVNALPGYRYTAAGSPGVHFIHVRGGTGRVPIILTHGWPGSFLEMLRILPLLSDQVDVVIPSLPGYGFSDRPSEPGMNVWRVADVWAGLMAEIGYDRFFAQGGDIGAGVTTALGLRHAQRLLGIHLNYIPGSYRPWLDGAPPLTEEESEFLTGVAQWTDEEGAYGHMQRTRPLTAAYGLNDSPAGLAAWIVEKVRAWADCGGDPYRVFTRNEILANVTLYWMTETIHSSFRMYAENRKEPLVFGAGDFVRVPGAVARFPREAPFPPRSWVERGYNVQRWTEMPRGGHFAAAEQPELLAADILDFATTGS